MIGLRSAVATALLLAGLMGMASCDKAKLAVDAAREKFRGATDPDAPATPGGDVAPEMASQVDSAADGVRFRRDLPFPTQLGVKVTETRSYLNARVTRTSALGRESATITMDWETVALLDRRAQHVGVAIERSGEIVRPTEGEEKPDAGVERATGGSLPRIGFEQGPSGWRLVKKQGPVEFQTKIREQILLPAMGDLVSRHGLGPRPQWFSASRRWAAGDRLVLEGDSLQVIFPPKSTGKVTLIYEVAEPIDGHPCGRFSVSGEVSLKSEVRLSGQSVDQDATIRSGKIWCSLLYPLVLREEYDSVVTEVEGSGSGPKSRFQGNVKFLNAWSWQKVTEG
jgi:hypothetical protein